MEPRPSPRGIMLVRIPWTWNGANKELWNHVSIRAIEQFGLPGDRYHCRVGVESMDYIFNDDRDALMFALEHGGKIIPQEEQTVEYVAKFL